MDWSLPASSVHGDSSGKNTEVGCHALLQGIFPDQGTNPVLPHCRQIFYCLSHQWSPSTGFLLTQESNWDLLNCRWILYQLSYLGSPKLPYDTAIPLLGMYPEKTTIERDTHAPAILRESFPRQVDRESRGSQGERGLELSRRKKGQTFFPSLHSLGLYNNNVSCLRTVFGLNLLANSVILKCKLWE